MASAFGQTLPARIASNAQHIRANDIECQLGKTTVNWKQRRLRFLHLVLAIENIMFSLCALFTAQTEHKRSTRIFKIGCRADADHLARRAFTLE
jgi:hypothetical protein